MADAWRFCIDRGGTFTDLVARSPTGEVVLLLANWGCADLPCIGDQLRSDLFVLKASGDVAAGGSCRSGRPACWPMVPCFLNVDPVRLELYNHRFAAIAELMDVRLQFGNDR